MRRRRLLTIAGVVAISTPTVGTSEADESEGPNCEDTVEIVTATSGGDPIETEEVPEVWHEQVEQARTVLSEIRAEYENASWYASSSLTSGDEYICEGLKMMAVRVRASDTGQAMMSLEEEREGVPIIVSEEQDLWPLSADEGDTSTGRIAGIGLVGALVIGGFMRFFSVHRRGRDHH